jgi:hypothetical protein
MDNEQDRNLILYNSINSIRQQLYFKGEILLEMILFYFNFISETLNSRSEIHYNFRALIPNPMCHH